MKTIQFTIDASTPEQEILVAELSELGCVGFEEKANNLIACFPADAIPEGEVRDLLQGYRYSIEIIDEQNWNEVWESNFQPVVVDDFCAVRAEFHQPIDGVQHEIVIQPKMSFGTGHHATTFMMMRQMKDIDFAGKKVFFYILEM